jgi:hypothetical protein
MWTVLGIELPTRSVRAEPVAHHAILRRVSGGVLDWSARAITPETCAWASSVKTTACRRACGRSR